MKRYSPSLVALAFISGLGASPNAAGAQSVDARCPPGTFTSSGVPDSRKIVQDVCQKALDVFGIIAPQLGLLISGGNATLGQGGALGGPGHFALELRANVIGARLPQVDKITPSIQGAVQSDYTTTDRAIPFPTLDGAFGLFGGVPLGVTNVFAIDALVSAAYMRSFSSDNLSVTVQGGSLRLGFGARVGLLQESLVTPGVSVTFLRRTLPTIDIVGTSGTDELRVTGIDATSDAWRITAGKSLVVFSVAIGVGQDRYSSSTTVDGEVTRAGVTTSSGPIAASQTMTRINYFGDLAINLPFAKLVGEIGRASGGTAATTYNTFSGKKPDDALTYGSIGLRIGF